MLTVEVPAGAVAERQWILDVVLGAFLGIPFRVAAGSTGIWRIRDGERELTMPDVFLRLADAAWLQPVSVPDSAPRHFPIAPLAFSDARVPPSLPSLFHSDTARVAIRTPAGIDCALDLPGALFFLLSRYEEAVCGRCDRYGRIRLDSLGPLQRDDITRPLADEYTALLRCLFQDAFPALPLRAHAHAVRPTHDVDRPFREALEPVGRTLRRAAADLIRRGEPGAALARLARRGAVAVDLRRDRWNTFDWLMRNAERRGLRSTFYFIADTEKGPFHGDYPLDAQPVASLLSGIRARGHEVGLHGGFDSFSDATRLAGEKARLEAAAAAASAPGTVTSVRQHYLRWTPQATPPAQAGAGFTRDGTLAFAECAGFRCGTSHAYPMYDLGGRRALPLWQQPLIVMDRTLLGSGYMDLPGSDDALRHAARLKAACRLHGGEFTVLWHNCHLELQEHRDLYERILDA